jgi:high-affinity nickel-transport protein
VEWLTVLLLASGLGGAGVYTAALALGVRHGIDWDHIAAITDITSTTAGVEEEEESWLIGEPGLMLTDESHHAVHGPHDHADAMHPIIDGDDVPHSHGEHHEAVVEPAADTGGVAVMARPATKTPTRTAIVEHQRTALLYGSLYALGHGAVVVVLGMAAILASEFLPSWIDPVMERVVGVTLIVLSLYLFYSLYRFFKGGGEFRLRSRWMLVFAGVSNAWHWVRSRVGPHEHVHVHATQSYGARTSFGVGLIHGIGAETGTQALVIATAVGATSQLTGVFALLAFVIGLLVSNSFVTIVSAYGFVSAQKRQWIYVGVGLIAAIFSMVIGVVFLGASTGVLPDLDRFVRWIGGPSD